MRGTFIVFEGPDGGGKSTMIAAAEDYLTQRGHTVTCVQDPGHTPIGQQVRRILLDPANTAMCSMTELLLYIASRAQLVAEVIEPALGRGETVLADRFTLSTLIYQGVGDWLEQDDLRDIVHLGIGQCLPDHVLILDVPLAIGMQRVGATKDRMEAKGKAYHDAVHAGYKDWAARHSAGEVSVIDAAREPAAVKADVLAVIDTVLAARES